MLVLLQNDHAIHQPASLPQHFLYFFPLPHGHGSFRPTFGGKVSGDRVEKLLNEWAAQGWQLKAITATDVKGRVGPGGVEGLLVTFERQV